MYRWLHIQTYMDMHWPTAVGTTSLYTITHARVGICLITDTWATAAGTTYIHTTLCTCGHVLFTCHTHGYDVLDTTQVLQTQLTAQPQTLHEVVIVLLRSKGFRACMVWVRPEIMRRTSFCAISVANEASLPIPLLTPLCLCAILSVTSFLTFATADLLWAILADQIRCVH